MSLKRVEQLSEIAPLIDDWFNPPEITPDFSEGVWEQEYGAVHEQVFECLQRAEAVMTDLAEEAFSMGPPFSRDRVVCVVVNHIDLINSELLRQLHQLLVDAPRDYRIVIDGSDRNGKQFYLVLSRQDTISYADDPTSLSPLGFV